MIDPEQRGSATSPGDLEEDPGTVEKRGESTPDDAAGVPRIPVLRPDQGRGDIEGLRARDVMSASLVVVHADDSLLMAWETMSATGVHHLPVLDGDRLLAIVSERELAVQWVIEPLAQQRRQIRELARHRPPEVSPDDDLRHVADCMRVGDTDAVAVTGRDGSLQGLITAKDVLAAVASAKRFTPRPPEHSGGAPTLFRLMPATAPSRVEEDTAAAAVTPPRAT